MRVPNDIILAQQVFEIDLILGGHDHDFYCELVWVNYFLKIYQIYFKIKPYFLQLQTKWNQKVNEKWVIKSGSDFRNLSLIEIDFNEKKPSVKKIEKFTIDSKVKEDEEVKEMVEEFMSNKIWLLVR